jgi:hypothetical protein
MDWRRGRHKRAWRLILVLEESRKTGAEASSARTAARRVGEERISRRHQAVMGMELAFALKWMSAC